MTKQIIAQKEYAQNILQLAQNHDLVLLDLDDVVLTTKQYTCSTQWYYRYHHMHKSSLNANDLADNVYRCMEASTFIAVSHQFIQDFSTLSNSKMVFGLTARRISFADKTDEHLSNVGMTFSQGLPQHHLIQNNVIYVGYKPGTAEPDDKGIVLNSLITNNFFGNISSVILIDDSLKNLNNVYNALSDPIDFTGIHYTKINSELLDNYSESQLLMMGEVQFDHFNTHGTFLNNNDALMLEI